MDPIADLYRIRDWAKGHYEVNGAGEVVAVLKDKAGVDVRVSLMEVIQELDRLGLSLPAILRFPDILVDRVRSLTEAFNQSIERHGYQGTYAGCFPMKVNQKRDVINEIASLGEELHFGLEAGTKAELIAGIARMQRDSEAHLVCNGYKDEVFVDLALYATKAGIKTVIVLERSGELPLILDRARVLGIKPRLGVRIRINSSGAGRWSSTAGSQGQFGLSPLEVIRSVDLLKEEGLLDCLYMLHYHQGSQIPDLNTVRRGVEEAANFYVELISEGAELGAINIGGGLAIDYEGAAVISNSSKNYSLGQYCETVVEIIRDYMELNELPHPVIITESGRAVCSHYSTLVFDVLDGGRAGVNEAYPPKPDSPKELDRLFEILENLDVESASKSVAEADGLIHHCQLSFAAGACTLRDLAAAEKYRECLIEKLGRISREQKLSQDHLDSILTKYYFANFSVFQSLPDAWAIGQLFPIMPIHRLDEMPDFEGIIADITCDCDGKIKRYIGSCDDRSSLPLHPVRAGEPYYLGAFLVGAYQETLGDIHNLLGKPTVVSVRIQEGELQFDGVIEGDSIADILSQVGFSETELFDSLLDVADEAHGEGRISGVDRNALVRLIGETLNSPTYLDLERNRNPDELEKTEPEKKVIEVSEK